MTVRDSKNAVYASSSFSGDDADFDTTSRLRLYRARDANADRSGSASASILP
jgi:hypothetical protein